MKTTILSSSGAVLLLVGLLTLTGLSLLGQTNPNQVTIQCVVTDRNGQPVPDITAGSIQALENRKPVTVTLVQPMKDLPLHMAVVIDSSNSQKSNPLYNPTVQGAYDFMKTSIQNPANRLMVVVANTTPTPTEWLALGEFEKLQLNLQPGGGTSLFDGMLLAAGAFSKLPAGPARRVLIILSDGNDNNSKHPRNEVITAAQKAGITIFAINTQEYSVDVLMNGDPNLQKFVDETGGRIFHNLGKKDFPGVFTKVQQLLDGLYAVTFSATEPPSPGKSKTMEVKTIDRKLKITGPKDYFSQSGQ
ncbi:MAG TPA: VWA domain-containing protein [Terriglobales bacterium]|nr:VWA domain-containing protein [Terriglobales bacterium]